MKYLIVVPDGIFDLPLEELDEHTPLETARTPNMDEMSLEGRHGLVGTVPKGLPAEGEVAVLSVLGYNPRKYRIGLGAFVAGALNVPLDPTEKVFRCSLVTLDDKNRLTDVSAGRISSKEAAVLLTDLQGEIRPIGARFHHSLGALGLCVLSSPALGSVKCTAPHNALNQPVARAFPSGKGRDLLVQIMEHSRAFFADHDINRVRIDLGENPASMLWLWGEGRRLPSHGKKEDLAAPPPFQSPHVRKAAVISDMDFVAGAARMIGWDSLAPGGTTREYQTDYAACAAQSLEALEDYDLVLLYFHSPHDAALEGDATHKIDCIEKIDELALGPILQAARDRDDLRLMIAPLLGVGAGCQKPLRDAVPCAIFGAGVTPLRGAVFCEKTGAEGELQIAQGHDLMEYFLRP